MSHAQITLFWTQGELFLIDPFLGKCIISSALAVKVPLDAYVMDFVFSEKEEGGIFDNKNGMDYHIPVFGGIAKEPPMHIVHISVEMAPIAKVRMFCDSFSLWPWNLFMAYAHWLQQKPLKFSVLKEDNLGLLTEYLNWNEKGTMKRPS